MEEDSKSDATIMAAMKKVRGFNKHAAASTPRPRDTPRPRCPAEAKAHKAAQIAAKAAAARPDDRDPENHSRNRDVDRDHNLWGLAPDGVAIDAPPRDAHALQHAYAPEEDFSDCALPKLELGGDDDAALAAAADADADAEKEEEDPWPPSSPSGGSTRGGTATAAVSAFRPRLSITRDIPIAPTRHHGHGTMAKATHDVIEIVSESSVVSVTRCVNLAREGVVGAGVEVSSYASPSSLHADVAARLHAELKASDANAANANANAADANAADVGAASALGRLVARAVRCRCPDVYRVVVSVRAAPKTTRGDDTDTDTDDGDDDDAGSDAGRGRCWREREGSPPRRRAVRVAGARGTARRGTVRRRRRGGKLESRRGRRRARGGVFESVRDRRRARRAGVRVRVRKSKPRRMRRRERERAERERERGGG